MPMWDKAALLKDTRAFIEHLQRLEAHGRCGSLHLRGTVRVYLQGTAFRGCDREVVVERGETQFYPYGRLRRSIEPRDATLLRKLAASTDHPW